MHNFIHNGLLFRGSDFMLMPYYKLYKATRYIMSHFYFMEIHLNCMWMEFHIHYPVVIIFYLVPPNKFSKNLKLGHDFFYITPDLSLILISITMT